MDSKIKLLDDWRGGLIVSCQAPEHSPLAEPEIIAAFAATAEQNGAVGVRIDRPENIRAVKKRIKIPVLGIYKIVSAKSEVYITPTFEAAKEIDESGADMIALDSTRRERPNGAKLRDLIVQIQTNLKKPLMADVSRLEEGLYAAEELGVDVISTTLSGYTAQTQHIAKPDFELVEALAEKLNTPIICEGRVRSPEDVKRAFDCGAYAVVVGGAITGIDQLVSQFVAATPQNYQKISCL